VEIKGRISKLEKANSTMAKSQVQFTKDNEYYTPKEVEEIINKIVEGFEDRWITDGKNDMKITNITKEYYEVNGEKVYFLAPLEKVISIKELQKIMDMAEELVNKLREGKTI
jgi:hypothetical protein